MLEIPSAILVGGLVVRATSPFASLGTNDLTQYTLAVDRGNPALERYRDAMHPAVLRLIAMAAESAARAGISLSVCGEMGGDPAAALALVGLGVRQLSMGAASLPSGPAGDPRAVGRGAAETALARPPRPLGRGRAGPVHGPAAPRDGRRAPGGAGARLRVRLRARDGGRRRVPGRASPPARRGASTRWAAGTPAGCRPLLRVAALVQAVLLAVLAAIVLDAAGRGGPRLGGALPVAAVDPGRRVRARASCSTPRAPARRRGATWVPVAIVLLVSSGAVALLPPEVSASPASRRMRRTIRTSSRRLRIDRSPALRPDSADRSLGVDVHGRTPGRRCRRLPVAGTVG